MTNKKQKPREMGRRTLYGETMKQTAIFLPKHMLDWLKSQPGTMSETVRNLVDEAMRRNAGSIRTLPQSEVESLIARSDAAAVIGSIGGSRSSASKARASRENGKLGGRPRKSQQ